MKRCINIFKIISLLIINLLVLYVLFRIFKGMVLIATLVIAFLAGLLLMIKVGKTKILRERQKIDAYAAAKMPIKFDVSNIIWGYIFIFMVSWVIIPSLFLLPANIAIAYTLPPIAINYVVLAIKWRDLWREFNLHFGSYFLLHFIGLLIPSIIVLLIKILLF